jgi:hypothetical protein
MDNRHISVQSEGREAFDLAFQLLFDNAPGGKASHYFEHPEKGLVFLWHEEAYGLFAKASKLPYAMRWKEAADLAWGWLSNQPNEKYTEKLDHDGSNGKGFLVYNEYWGHIGESHYAFLGVKPVWAWYGK